MARRVGRALLALLVACALAAPAAAQANETPASDGGENATPGDESGDNGTADQAFPAREGQIPGPLEGEPEAAEAEGEPAGAAALTLAVIVVSLIVGFAAAAAGGKRR